MRRIAVLTALALLFPACGGPTGPEESALPPGEVSLAIVQGDSQEVAVTDTLPFDAVTRVVKGGEPLADQLVDWKVTESGCGAPFVTTTRTDDEGKTGNRAVAGTRAWTRPDAERFCRLEVRYALTRADSVIAEVDTAFHYLVLPGSVSSVTIDDYAFTGGGTTRTLPGDVIADVYDNPGLWRLRPECCAHREGDGYGTVDARTLTVDSAGKGLVHAVVADTVVATGIIETQSDGFVRIDFAAYDGGQ